MLFRSLCRWAFVVTAAVLPAMPSRAELPPLVGEYVLADNCAVTPRSEYQSLFPEQVIERGEGLRADRWITGTETASLTVLPTKSKPASVVLICPGGGYGGLSFVKEGTFVAEWLRDRGVAAAVLKYATRSGEKPPLGDRPLKQAQRALALLKNEFDAPVGVMGFSAGGHLAASAANVVADGGDSRPDFHVLVYPVISMRNGVAHSGSRRNLLGPSPTNETIARMSMDEQVTPNTPPALLIHTVDDKVTPLDNSLRYAKACQAAGVPVDLRVYPTGGHGYGMAHQTGTIATWPAALEAWLKANNWMR